MTAYRTALKLADDRDDLTEISDVEDHVSAFVAEHPELQHSLLRSRQRVRVSEGPAGTVTVRATTTVSSAFGKVGRNAPCPCGSGRKYKRCCSPRA